MPDSHWSWTRLSAVHPRPPPHPRLRRQRCLLLQLRTPRQQRPLLRESTESAVTVSSLGSSPPCSAPWSTSSMAASAPLPTARLSRRPRLGRHRSASCSGRPYRRRLQRSRLARTAARQGSTLGFGPSLDSTSRRLHARLRPRPGLLGYCLSVGGPALDFSSSAGGPTLGSDPSLDSTSRWPHTWLRPWLALLGCGMSVSGPTLDFGYGLDFASR